MKEEPSGCFTAPCPICGEIECDHTEEEKDSFEQGVQYEQERRDTDRSLGRVR